MLLYAQPVSRLIRLTTDDIMIDDEDIGLRLAVVGGAVVADHRHDRCVRVGGQ
ncbi:hypothetical protein HDA40_005540 [Hamadaea flava]|uniref:Uncharacterized protein n=1 Tax=Hamadaea flava TaxID=1742688 RepID=A0ABV8LSE8_9ACTN|nr:hypothetical protein [Hamadaea flava]MCP2327033.1 hypothetical protein [Hamadaea flava]